MVTHILKVRLAILLLSIGLAATYFYAGISGLQSPENWIGFLPQFIRDNPLAGTILTAFSIFEIGLAVWLVSGIKTTLAALVSMLLMAGIIFVDLSVLIITFRDIGLAFASMALAVLAKH